MLPQVHPTLGRTIGMLCIDNWLNQGVLEGTQRLSSALKRLCNLFLFVTGWLIKIKTAINKYTYAPKLIDSIIKPYFNWTLQQDLKNLNH